MKNRILIFDVETTGLLPKLNGAEIPALIAYPYIIQFSFILFNLLSQTIERKYNYYIDIPKDIEISEKITELTGVTREILNKKGQSLIIALDNFYDCYMLADTVVAHNFDFDSKMIQIETQRNFELIREQMPYGLNLFNNIYERLHSIDRYCTMRQGTNLCNIMVSRKDASGVEIGKPYKKWPTLLELYVYLFNKTPSNLHNSMMDVLVCLRCYLKMRKKVDIQDVDFQHMIEDCL
jgi:DNA polymerase-3 subunit alpha